MWRRTVLVAGPSPLRLYESVISSEHIFYMKAKITDSREMEPVGIVISRGLRTEPAPVILAFEWGPAPELSPVTQDHQAA